MVVVDINLSVQFYLLMCTSHYRSPLSFEFNHFLLNYLDHLSKHQHLHVVHDPTVGFRFFMGLQADSSSAVDVMRTNVHTTCVLNQTINQIKY